MKKHKPFIIKSICFVLLIILLIVLVRINYNDAERKKALSNTIADITALNDKQIFSIDKIYLYSSADAINNQTKKSMWDLDVYQFTEIAMYISAIDDGLDNTDNRIDSIYIDNIKFNNLETGSPSLYYKDVNEFGKFNLKPENLLENSFTFLSTDTPLTLEYVNLVKKNSLISDLTNPLVYDGSILKRAGISLSSINCTLSFQMHLQTSNTKKYLANVNIKIPLTDNTNSIYDGNFSTELKNKIPFIEEK
mgnify:FL=1